MPRHVTPLRVRWSEVDRDDVVHFAAYYHYFETAEIEMFRALGSPQHTLLDDLGLRMPRVEAHCTYKRPARYDDLIEVRTGVRFERRAITFDHEIYRPHDATLLTTGYVTVVCVDFRRRQYGAVVTPPQRLVTFLTPYVL